MRKISHLPVSHKRMNRYLLDVGFCCGRRLFSFFVLTKREFQYTRIEQSSQMGDINECMRQ